MTRPALILGPGLLLALAACAEMRAARPRPPPRAGTCGADERQDWVGQSVASLNDVDLPEGTRVLFPTTPATMDFNAERLNVAVDAADASPASTAAEPPAPAAGAASPAAPARAAPAPPAPTAGRWRAPSPRSPAARSGRR